MKYKIQLPNLCSSLNAPVVIDEADDLNDALIQASEKDPAACVVMCDNLTAAEFEELYSNESWVYLDRSTHDLKNIFLLIYPCKINMIETEKGGA